MRLHSLDPKLAAPALLPALGTANALLTAGDRAQCNTMTIGWCQTGRLWGLQTCTVYVRPERYTYQFMESAGHFSVCVLPDTEKATMAFCGSKSGRQFNKIKECGLTLRYGAGDTPFFEEAELVLICRKLYVQDMDPAAVLPAGKESILPYYGQKGGWHRIYTGEIVEAFSAAQE
ncbi:flavin reductase [Oscillospiraceae bacterium 38-13]